MQKPRIAMLTTIEMTAKAFAAATIARMADAFDLVSSPFETAEVGIIKDIISGADGCVTSWGTCQLTAEILDAAPNLKIICHAAGSVKPIVCEAVWDRGITVTSAAAAIAFGVAEHTLGLMLSTMKRTYWMNDIIHNGGWQDKEEMGRVVEIYGITVGVVGAGHVGRRFMELLCNFDLNVVVYDPFLAADEAQALGAAKVENLDELVSRSDVLSLHAPSIPETHHMLDARRLSKIKDGAILINTARGSLIDESALYNELKKGRFTACLDVTDPEPPEADNPLRSLSNVIFTPHIAGAVANNTMRLGKLAADELERFFTGREQLYPVTREDLARVA